MKSTTSTRDPLEERNDEIEAGVTRLIQDAKAVRAATSVMEGATPANRQRYEAQVVRTLAIMEVDLGHARETLSSNAALTSADRRDTVHEVVEATQRWLSDLRSTVRHSIDGIYHHVG